MGFRNQQRGKPRLFRQGTLLARYKQQLPDPDLRPELELAPRATIDSFPDSGQLLAT